MGVPIKLIIEGREVVLVVHTLVHSSQSCTGCQQADDSHVTQGLVMSCDCQHQIAITNQLEINLKIQDGSSIRNKVTNVCKFLL